MKNVLVTGATGFIGNYVINELLQNGYKVTATSSSKQKAQSASWFRKINYIEFNLDDFDNSINYYQFFNHPDALIHLAWQGLPNYKQAFHTKKNLPVHFSFIKNLITNGLKDITITGTCFEYGMKEGCLTETLETAPDNAYAIAKNELRKKLEALKAGCDFNFKWIRLFYMYGKGQSANSLISQLDKALANNEEVFNMSGGEQTRDFLPIEMVAAYIVKIATQQTINGIINCCSGKPISVKQFVLYYLKQQKKSIKLNLGIYPYPTYEPMHFWGDNKKLNTVK